MGWAYVMQRLGGRSAAVLLLLSLWMVAVPDAVALGAVEEVVRVAGPGREATAAAVSARVRTRAETVLLARSDDAADALTAGPLAGLLDAPVLLTGPETLSLHAREEVERLGAGRVIVLGGPAAITEPVLEELESIGVEVERVAGEDRFATAGVVARRVGGTDAFLVRGSGADPAGAFADAVAVSALAARLGRPVLLTEPDMLPDATAHTLQAEGIDAVTIIGGPTAVSEQVADAVRTLGIDVERIAGQTRYATSRAVVQHDRELAGPTAAMWVATGRSIVDALVAGPAAAASGASLLLVDGTAIDADQLVFEVYADLLRPTTSVTVVGGEAAVTDPVMRTVTQLAAGGPPGNPDAVVADCADLEAPPPVDGPLSEDPDVAQAQLGRADYGLPSDEATVRQLLADPELSSKFGFPATAEEVAEIFGRNDIAFTYQPIVTAYAAEAAPDTYAGSWLDHHAGGVLRVAFTHDADRHEDALLARTGPDAPLATTTVAHSLAELSAVRARVELPGYPDEDAIVAGHGLRMTLNRLALDVQAADGDTRRQLAADYGGDRICINPIDGPGRSDPPGGGVEGAIALPATETANIEAALLSGVVLHGDPTLDGGCVWVEDDEGRPQNIIWPPKYAVRFTEVGFDLLDHDGAVVATEGDRLAMGGGFHEATPSRCDVTGDGTSFIAGSVNTEASR